MLTRRQTRKPAVATTGLAADPGPNDDQKLTRIEHDRSETLGPFSGGAESGSRVSQEASERLVPTPPPTETAPPAPDVALPLSDDQALVAALAQLGDEFGNRAARSSLTRVRTLRHHHHLCVEEVTCHLDEAARLTRACRTVQQGTRMAYLLTVLENILAAPPASTMAPGAVSEQRRWRHPAPPTSLDRQGISRYIGGSYGVCAHCLSSPCEGDCPTRTHDLVDHTTAGATRQAGGAWRTRQRGLWRAGRQMLPQRRGPGEPSLRRLSPPRAVSPPASVRACAST